MALGALRRRMPLLGFILLAVLCIALFGFACACLSDHPMQALERSVVAMAALPALVEVWPASVAALFAAVALAAARRLLSESPSPAALQRFLL